MTAVAVAQPSSLANPINQPSIPGTIARTWRAVLLLTDTAADRCYDQAVAPHPPMSEEQLKAFLEKVKSDTSLQEELKAAADADAVLAIAKEAGFSIATDDLKNATAEIEDAELEAAAGGLLLAALPAYGGCIDLYSGRVCGNQLYGNVTW